MYIIDYKGEIVKVPGIKKKNNKSYYSYLWETKYKLSSSNKENKYSYDKIISSHLDKINKV